MRSIIKWLLMILFAMIAVGVVYRVLIALQGMRVTSWWRSPVHNYEVGGKPTSWHLFGLAFDVVPVNQENMNTLKAMGLAVINEGDHLHAQIV